MTRHRYSAVLACVAITFAQASAGQAFAWQQPAPAEVASLKAAIQSAIDPIKNDPSMTPVQKQAAMNAAVLAAVKSSGASDSVVANALIESVGGGFSAEMATFVAAQVSTSVVTIVVNAPSIRDATLAAAGPLVYEAAKTDEAIELIEATSREVEQQPGYSQKSLAEKSAIMSAAIVKALSDKSFNQSIIRSALSQSLDGQNAASIYMAAEQLDSSLAYEMAGQQEVYQQMVAIAAEVVSVAANAAKSAPGFSSKPPEEQSAAINIAIAKALSERSFRPEIVVAAWGSAVSNNFVSAQSAQGATGVDFSSSITSSNIQTASNELSGAPNVIQNLQSVFFTSSTNAGSSGSSGSITTSNPAPFDPCAGVIAAYCG